ncbi:MAG: molybdate ABC transporter substrate-binding protein [Rhodoferax sp.]|uniref:molybdate ABC transporter substrate-binding protein n=1 Tax=Rhodoferax sp. TaxID=50421 RepID=UPI00272F6145|nr:molybdate ABC transporter substrate-binding protein [Rhodoferax sp.]MDP1529260.1 molybdate ABC transporter substrate-binding protein [Rhodoferax sp.]
MARTLTLLIALLLSILATGMAHAGQAHIAVASNFVAPMKTLASQFEQATGHTLTLSSGATGKFYAQIKHGAPFDVLLAADDDTPARLVREGDGNTRFTYAIGRLALWSAKPELLDGTDAVLKQNRFRRLAIASPKLAPYGAAAGEVLAKLKLTDSVQGKFVIGENIAQTYQFVASGNAELGFVALSQVMQGSRLVGGSVWMVPATLHTPIRQDAVLLKHGANNAAARALLDYLKTPAAQTIIRSYGYDR